MANPNGSGEFSSGNDSAGSGEDPYAALARAWDSATDVEGKALVAGEVWGQPIKGTGFYDAPFPLYTRLIDKETTFEELRRVVEDLSQSQE